MPLRAVSVLLFIVASLPVAALAGGLKGDPEALSRVDAMLERLGGKALWASTRSLYTMERARHPGYGDGIVATFWRDLESPAERAEIKHARLDIQYAWNEKGGWVLRDGEVRDYDAGEIDARVDNWAREIYTLYHQLATGDRALTVKSLEPNGFRVLDENLEKIGDFRLTAEGALYYWQQYGEDPVAYIYGPNKAFGEVRFPDWGTAVDGSWGFYYVQVFPSSKPFGVNASVRKPKTEWLGGALHPDNCTK